MIEKLVLCETKTGDLQIFSLNALTKLHYFMFEFSKFFWEGAHRAPPQTPPPLYLGLLPRYSGALRQWHSHEVRGGGSRAPSTLPWTTPEIHANPKEGWG